MSLCPKLTPTPTIVRNGARTFEEVDGAETPNPAVAVGIAVTITETSRSQNILSKEK